MDSNSEQDVELAKKSCEKAREIVKSKRNAALALLASIGICLTLVVVTFVIGSLFGYYLANVQMLRIEQNVETVKEGKVETNQTIGEMEKVAQQLEHKVENNQTTISTTTQISTNTRTPSTDEESIASKILNSFDSNENDVLNPVFKPTETLEPQDYDDDNADEDDEDADAVQEPVSQKLNETTTQNPYTPQTPFRMNHLLPNTLFYKHNQFVHRIHQCPLKLSQTCSGPAQQKVFEAQNEEMWSIILGDFPANESEAQYITRIQNWTHQLDAAIERIVSTPVDLCAGHDDYAECESCVKRNANCYFTNGYICKTQVEWNIIGYTPIMSMADKDLCSYHPIF